jgi:hypothetical protein
MRELRTEIEFEGTPEEVWEVLADLPAYGEWNPVIKKVDGEPKTGALWRKLRDGGMAEGFRAMNEALARRVAELRRKAN